MRGLMRKISYMLMLMAISMLMGMRVMPHHHCGCSTADVASIHFGITECDKCEHHGCDEEEEHSGRLCYDASLFYFRLASDDTFVAKKSIFPIQLIALLNISALADMPAVKLQWSEFREHTPPEQELSTLALRGPPAA
ncbi:MAG: hypothetical protein IKJ49_00030 [Bacteroidaceae bacterium]|nr:hypothetical protein [Bacteroidaceae bacterium]